MSGNPVQDLVMQLDRSCTGTVYKIISAEYEWKPCAGPGDAGGQVLYWHRVYVIILAQYEWKLMQVDRSCTETGFTKFFWQNMSGNPVQDLVMQVDRSCTGTGFMKLFWLNGNPVQDLVMQVDRPCTGTGFTKLFRLNMSGNPVQDLVMQVDRSCTGSLKFPDFLDMMSRILDSR